MGEHVGEPVGARRGRAGTIEHGSVWAGSGGATTIGKEGGGTAAAEEAGGCCWRSPGAWSVGGSSARLRFSEERELDESDEEWEGEVAGENSGECLAKAVHVAEIWAVIVSQGIGE